MIETVNASKQTPAQRLLNIKTVYYEPVALDYERGREILSRYPDAELIEVASHWKIPELHGNEGSIRDWVKIKKNVLVLGVKKSLACVPYERSSDFVAPSHANGCAMACAYCYVPRRKGFANPITVFANIDQICGFIERHARKQGVKPEATLADETLWAYEIGTNSDCSVDALLSDNIRDLIRLFHRLTNAKCTFATKFVNREMLNYDPQGHTRLRFSLMPQAVSKIVDVRTSRISERIEAVNDFVDAGYEVHFNFGPVIYTENWQEEYAALFEQIDDVLHERAKAQLAAEVIFLTHNERLHEVNLGWHPKAEAMLWRPELQETKISGTGGRNVRYKRGLKRDLVETFKTLLRQKLPYCHIRYAF